jgi:hypothetical protein
MNIPAHADVAEPTIHTYLADMPDTTDTTNTFSWSDNWTAAIEVVVHRDPQQGTYQALVYNADESLAKRLPLDAIGERAAVLEATAWIKDEGWEPVGRWSGEDGEESTRSFRKAASA